MRKRNQAFALIQILFAVFIASSLTSFIGSAVRKLDSETKKVLLEVDRKNISVALETYFQKNNHYPFGGNAQMVQALMGKYLRFDPKSLKKNSKGFLEFLDPWQIPYVYAHKRGQESYKFFSTHDNFLDKRTDTPKVEEHRKEKKKDEDALDQKKDHNNESLSNLTGVYDSVNKEKPKSSDSGNLPPSDQNDNTDGDDQSKDESDEEDKKETDDSKDDDDSKDNDDSDLPQKPAMHLVANDNFVFMKILNIPKEYDTITISRSKDSSAFSEQSLQFFSSGGNIIWNSGSTSLTFMDSNVNNNSRYGYQAFFFLKEALKAEKKYPEKISTDIAFVTPLAESQKIFSDALDLFSDQKVSAVKGQYSYTIPTLKNQLETDNVSIFWGYEPKGSDAKGESTESTLAYIVSRINSQSNKPESFIVFNGNELRNASLEKIAAVLSHEAVHHYWIVSPPPIPSGSSPLTLDSSFFPQTVYRRSSGSSSKKKAVNRSFNSIDEEYECFLMSIRFWKIMKGAKTDRTFDYLLSLLNGQNGEKELRDYIRLVYEGLPEF